MVSDQKNTMITIATTITIIVSIAQSESPTWFP